MKKYLKPVILFVAIVVVTQYYFIAFLPNIIFAIAKFRSGKPLNTIIQAPKTDAKLRRVVLPNPDFMYDACFYDVSKNDLLITGEFADTTQYCSLAFYAANVQPYYVMNNLQGFKKKYSLRLSSVARVNGCIKTPSTQGTLLMRVLVTDSTQYANAKRLQQIFKATVLPQD
jgi:uncharacterized membrane protein